MMQDEIISALVEFKQGSISLSGTNGALSRILKIIQANRKVTGEMIERAVQAYDEYAVRDHKGSIPTQWAQMREALEAALGESHA